MFKISMSAPQSVEAPAPDLFGGRAKIGEVKNAREARRQICTFQLKRERDVKAK